MMEEIIKKAEVLIEALPYIKRFYGKIIVVKFGGSTIADEGMRLNVLEDIIFMSCVGMMPVLIHGGGPLINQRMKELGKRIEFVEGLRVTDEETLGIVEESLSKLNTEIVNSIRELGGKASGLSSKRYGLIKVKRYQASPQAGLVGEIVSINPKPINKLTASKTIPVISPLGVGGDRKTYNVNADQASAYIASSVGAEKLLLFTNVRGIMRDREDENSLISTLSSGEAEELITRSIIQEGMIPKVKACIGALKGGVKKTHIIDGRTVHSLLLEIFTDKGIGTEIVR